MSKMKIASFGIGFLVMIVAIGWAGGAQAADGSAAELQNADVYWHSNSGISGIVDGAGARLVRTDNNVSASFKAKDLNPGNVYTLWWIIVNNPDACAAFPCTAPEVLFNTDVQADVTYGGGIVAGGSGKGTISSHLAVGDLANSWLGNGFQDARNSEIHLVVNDHGPKIPDQLGDMLHTYRGGCTNESLIYPFPATAKSDGIPGPNTCVLYQAAAFQ